MKYEIDNKSFKLRYSWDLIILFLILLMNITICYASFKMYYSLIWYFPFIICFICLALFVFFIFVFFVFPLRDRQMFYLLKDESILIHKNDKEKEKEILFKNISKITVSYNKNHCMKLKIYSDYGKTILYKTEKDGLDAIWTKMHAKCGGA